MGDGLKRAFAAARATRKQAPRFPASMLAMVSTDPEASGTDPKEIARSLGAVKAQQWINSLYRWGLAPDVSFGVELPTVAVGYKPSKVEFAVMLDRVTSAFEPLLGAPYPHLYGFSRNNGTDQLRGRHVSIHEAYGFWDCLCAIAEELDLWAVLRDHQKKAEAGWVMITPPKCDLCDNMAVRTHPKGGLRCGQCPPAMMARREGLGGLN